MKRRAFITVLGGAALWPLAARAQQRAMPVVGFLRPGTEEETKPYVEAFRQGLKETGYIEGENVAIEYRFAEGQVERLPALAVELIQRGVKVIAAGGPPSTLAAKAATSTIPIVAAGFYEGSLDVVRNLSQPEGNLTGFAVFDDAALYGKRLELLREMKPQAASAVLLLDPRQSQGDPDRIASSANGLGMRLTVANAEHDADIEAAFATAAERQVDGLLVGGAAFFTVRHEMIVALAARYAMPTIYPWREYVTAGGLISYGNSITWVWHGAGVYVGKILNGATPSELPVQRPITFELVINMKTAKALGIDIPPSLLARADEVI